MAPSEKPPRMTDTRSGVGTGERYVKDEHGNWYRLEDVELVGWKLETRIKVK